MKKIIFVLTAVLALTSFALTGCDKKETATNKIIAPQAVEENEDETPEDEIEREHSDFKFVPKPIRGNAVDYEGEVYIIRFGNRKRCRKPHQKPAEPSDDSENTAD